MIADSAEVVVRYHARYRETNGITYLLFIVGSVGYAREVERPTLSTLVYKVSL